MLTPTFDPSDADTGLLTVRFWHTWEWSGTDVSDDVERRVQLLGADEQVLESIPLDGAEDSWATWAQRDVSFSVEPSGEVRVAFALTSKPTEEPMGYTWAIDHVVVYRSGAPD